MDREEKVNTIVAELVKRNGIAVNPKDPIMVVYTMIEILGEQHNEDLNKALLEFRSSIEEITQNWKQSISQQSSEEVNQFLEKNQDKIKMIVSAVINQTQEQAKKQIDEACSTLENRITDLKGMIDESVNKKVQETRNAAWLNLVSSAVVMVSVLILVFKFTFS